MKEALLTYEELVQLKQNYEIDWIEFVKLSGYAEEFSSWCSRQNLEESDKNAFLFLEAIEKQVFNLQ